MKDIKKIILKYGRSFAAFAFAFNLMAINKNCYFFFHQPKIPEGLDKFRNEM